MEKSEKTENNNKNKQINEIYKYARCFRRRQPFRLNYFPEHLSLDALSQAAMEGAASLIPGKIHTDTISHDYDNIDFLIDMKYIVSNSGLTNKFFYAQIKKGLFPSPIKLGRSSRWKLSEYEQWIEQRANNRGQ
ncbi:AlpA family transcriptional regulator [Klebsiella aerogenes]|uniref:Transcriptional regulator, AlpA family protein n=2 Tax=Gammaproteobacteria TaxID=1236 RepID=A0A0H3FLK4_KLEAK|nr:transcriptional regulator, AlpA family protein [Klebsiella aerogenes KCTC 2190]QEU20856.1 AlpA family transcriptional regulator [Klebsiella aerogenes]RFP74219.1 AlpA family transcriptional regulator [Klebsiella aerogenes]